MIKSEFITDTGAGPALVMINGWGQGRGAFEPLAKVLAENKIRVITFDMAGHGLAKGRPGPFTFRRYCRDLADLVGSLRLERFHLLGWSMGGAISAMYCLDQLGPQPESLILLCATPRFTAKDDDTSMGQRHITLQVMERLLKSDPETCLIRFIQGMFKSGERIEPSHMEKIEQALTSPPFPPDTNALIETLHELAVTDLTIRQSRYMGRTLIISGGLDKICPPGGQGLWDGLFGRAENFLLNGCGHAAHLTRTEQVAERIMNFISGGN